MSRPMSEPERAISHGGQACKAAALPIQRAPLAVLRQEGVQLLWRSTKHVRPGMLWR